MKKLNGELQRVDADQIELTRRLILDYVTVTEKAREYICSIVRTGTILADKKGYDQRETVAAVITSLRDLYNMDVRYVRVNQKRVAEKALAILQYQILKCINPSYPSQILNGKMRR